MTAALRARGFSPSPGEADARKETGLGVAYTLDPAGQETVLYNFTGGAEGQPVRGDVLWREIWWGVVYALKGAATN